MWCSTMAMAYGPHALPLTHPIIVTATAPWLKGYNRQISTGQQCSYYPAPLGRKAMVHGVPHAISSQNPHLLFAHSSQATAGGGGVEKNFPGTGVQLFFFGGYPGGGGGGVREKSCKFFPPPPPWATAYWREQPRPGVRWVAWTRFPLFNQKNPGKPHARGAEGGPFFGPWVGDDSECAAQK